MIKNRIKYKCNHGHPIIKVSILCKHKSCRGRNMLEQIHESAWLCCHIIAVVYNVYIQYNSDHKVRFSEVQRQ